ncbi:MAG: outer membrane beta-barrel protein [Hoeflea sp.]|nr:outer membrane beta-barrel protein [Hoeflea sp.]
MAMSGSGVKNMLAITRFNRLMLNAVLDVKAPNERTIWKVEAMVRYIMILGLLASTSALAADSSASSNTSSVDWNGAYAGAFIGSISSDGRTSRGAYQGALLTLDVQNGLFPGSLSDMTTRLSGGISAGYNRQFGRFVAGVEADVSFSNIKSQANFSKIDPNPTAPFTGLNTITSYQTQFGTIGTARLRGGMTFDRTMIFASAGLAAGKVINRFTLDLPGLGYSSPGWSTQGTRTGFAVGVGIEHRLTDRVGVKFEAIGIDLQDSVVNAVDNATFPGETIDYHFKNQMLIGRVGLYMAF